jgi:signal transduction histidine kinase
LHHNSAYSDIWSFSRKEEEAYARYRHSKEIQYFRLFLGSLAAITAIFLIVDLARPVVYMYVAIFRGSLIFILMTFLSITYMRRMTPMTVQLMLLAAFIISYGCYITMSKMAKMPSFTLPNVFLLLMYMAMTFSGLRFRIAVILNFSVFIVFVLHALYENNLYHQSQFPNLSTNLLLSAIAGAFIENDKRFNYRQYTNLLGQKNMFDELNQQKSKIISILSHDIAAPLRSLSGLLDMHKTNSLTQQEFETYLPDVRARLDNASSLVYSLVRWSKSQIEGFHVDSVHIDVAELLRENSALFAGQAQEKNIRFDIHAEPSIQAQGDCEMVKLIVRNLMSNAVKFSFPGKDVVVTATRQQGNVVIAVTNEGKPLGQETRETLFTYSVISSSGTANEKGTGLGLAMAQHFARLNHGAIDVESTNGITTFRLVLPAV